MIFPKREGAKSTLQKTAHQKDFHLHYQYEKVRDTGVKQNQGKPQSSAFNSRDASVPSNIKPGVLFEMEVVEPFASMADNGQLEMPVPYDQPKPTESKFQSQG